MGSQAELGNQNSKKQSRQSAFPVVFVATCNPFFVSAFSAVNPAC